MLLKKEFKLLNNCLCCYNTDLKQVINLGKHSLPNYYPLNKNEKLKTYPLKLNLCKNCYHLQLSLSLNPDLMFKDYIYVSGTSKTLIEYFNQFVNKVNIDFNDINSEIPKTKKVLDIASNDGSLLKVFKKHGWDVLGIDPAQNLSLLANENGIPTINDYFEDAATKLKPKSFDVIVAQNVFAHISNPIDFLKAMVSLLKENGRIYIQTSQADMIPNGEWDTIYHEHLSFFNLNSMKHLIRKASLFEELFLNKVSIAAIHGGSYLFELTKKEPSKEERFEINQRYLIEAKEERLSQNKYEKYAKQIKLLSKNLVLELKKFKSQNYSIIGYGAAAKANTLLNYSRIDNSIIDYIIDDNDLKCGRYTPISNIPIDSIDNILGKYGSAENILFLPLAWNFYKEIRAKIKDKRNNQNDRFLLYFPNISIQK